MGHDLPLSIEMQISGFLEPALTSGKQSVKAFLVSTKAPLTKILEKRKDRLEKAQIIHYIIREEQARNSLRLSVLHLVKQTRANRYEGRYLILEDKNTALFMTIDKRDFFKQTLSSLGRALLPLTSTAYFTSKEIFMILDGISQEYQSKLKCSAYHMKRMYGVGKFTGSRYYKRDQEEEDFIDYQRAFNLAQANSAWIDTIEILMDVDGREEKFAISRDGRIRLLSGDLNFLYSAVIIRAKTTFLQKHALLSNRSRSKQPERESKPLILKFDEEIFQEMDVRHSLINTISQYENCSYSVVHSGNPHVNILLRDTLDASAFSLITYGNSALLLIPQLRASSASLFRLGRYLTEFFREGTLESFE